MLEAKVSLYIRHFLVEELVLAPEEALCSMELETQELTN
jgi:hypothetical protein